MKKVLIIMFVLFIILPAYSQDKVKLDFITFTTQIDSSNSNIAGATPTWKIIKVFWEQEYSSDNLKMWNSAGYYCMWCKITQIGATVTGDTDSLKIYCAPISPSGGIAANDTTAFTTNFTTTGFDFDLATDYVWNFTLPPAKGVAFYINRRCTTGKLLFTFYITR